MKKGEIVYISTRYGIIREYIKSVGHKYITTERHKFYTDTLREVDGVGVSAKIIEDIEQYKKDMKRKSDINYIKDIVRGDLSKLDESDIRILKMILNKCVND